MRDIIYTRGIRGQAAVSGGRVQSRVFFQQELHRRFEFKSPVRSFRVVPQQPRDKLAIELIGTDKQLFMVVNEFFLKSSIKSFHMGIHLGSFGIGMPMVFVQPSESPHRSAS